MLLGVGECVDGVETAFLFRDWLQGVLEVGTGQGEFSGQVADEVVLGFDEGVACFEGVGGVL